MSLSQHHLLLALLGAAACSEADVPKPPAVVGEDDIFAAGRQLPQHVDQSDLYFHYTAAGYFGDPLGTGPEAGLYRVPLTGGEASLLFASERSNTRREGDELVLVHREGAGALLSRVPLDGSAPSSQTLSDASSVASAISGGFTFVLASSDNGRMSITRIATLEVPEQSLLAKERAFIYGADFFAHANYLYWIESEAVHRIAVDFSQDVAETLAVPDLGADVPRYGQETQSEHFLLGMIGNEAIVLFLSESFIATGGELDNGDPKGVQDFGGGALYAVDTASNVARIIATDIRRAIVVEDVLYGQNRAGDTLRIEPATGEASLLEGRAPKFSLFETIAANSEELFYADDHLALDKDTFSIRAVSLAPKE